MKKENIRKILISVLALVMVTCLFAGCQAGGAETTAAPEPTEPPKAIVEDIYFNGDRSALGGKRTMDKTFEVWMMDFCGKGREASFRVATQELADSIDQHDFFVMTKDEKTQVVTGFKTIEQVGYKIIADRMFVTKIDGKKITVNNTKGDTGSVGLTFEITEDTNVYDVSGHVTRCARVDVAMDDTVVVMTNNLDEVTHVWIVKSVTPTRMQYCPCQECRAAELEETEFTGWMNTSKLPTASGHYYLTSDGGGGQQSIAKNAKIVLDLNGYTFTGAPEARIYSLHNTGCKLELMDSSEAQTGTLKASVDGAINAQGGCVWMRYGTFYLHSGTLDAAGATNKMNGVAMEISGDAFYMMGGTIKGGRALATIDTSTGALGGSYGGAIHCNANKIVEIHGGTIYGGFAAGLPKGDGYEEENRSKGGLMFVGNGTTLKVWKEAKLIGGMCTGGDGNMLYINTSGNIWFEDMETSLVFDNKELEERWGVKTEPNSEAIFWHADNKNNPAHPEYVDPNAPVEPVDPSAPSNPA